MRSKPFLLLLASALVLSLNLSPFVQAQVTQKIATEIRSSEYLFFLDEGYQMYATVPAEDVVPATQSRVQVQGVTVTLKAAPEGVRDIPEIKLECQGITYTAPAHKIVVLGERPKENGFFIHTAPDPNGSGNVECLVGWNTDKQPERGIWLDLSARPEGVKMLNQSTSSASSDHGYAWTMRLVLRNTTGTPFILKQEFFTNLPTLEEWPEIIIPPVKDKQ